MKMFTSNGQYPQRLYRGIQGRIQNAHDNFARKRKERLCRNHALPSISINKIAPTCPILPTPILDDACMPPHHYRPHDDFGTLMRIVADRQPSLVVELGTAHGNTVANICQINRNCRVVTVNAPIESQTGVITSFRLAREDIGRVYRHYGYQDRVTQIFENTLNLDLKPIIFNELIDLAIVDACHDKEYVINDFMKCVPFMARRGLILLHDTHPSRIQHLESSYLACAELRKQGFDIHHIEDTWWGVYSPSGF